jgi:hypothetical protein
MQSHQVDFDSLIAGSEPFRLIAELSSGLEGKRRFADKVSVLFWKKRFLAEISGRRSSCTMGRACMSFGVCLPFFAIWFPVRLRSLNFENHWEVNLGIIAAYMRI